MVRFRERRRGELMLELEAGESSLYRFDGGGEVTGRGGDVDMATVA